MTLHRSRRAPRRGWANTVELAVVAPVLFLFLFAILEYGRFVMVRQLLDNAAREGARLAAANPPFKYNAGSNTWGPQKLQTSDIQNTVLSFLAGQVLFNSSGAPLSASDISVYRADPATGNPMTDAKGSAWTSASFGEAIAVQVTVRYTPMFPGFNYLLNPTPISFICIMRSEAST
jgi:Flp pilus assembly protein TadG